MKEIHELILKEKLMHDLKPEWYPNITEWNYISEIFDLFVGNSIDRIDNERNTERDTPY